MSFEPGQDRLQMTVEERRAQRRRSVAIGVVLVAMVVVFYVVTIIKMGG